jgi:hypothetical protein
VKRLSILSRLCRRRFFVGRFAAYLLAVGGLFEAVVLLAGRMPLDSVILERGVVEQAQLVFLFLTLFGLLFLAIRRPGARGLYLLMSCLAALAAIRERDTAPWYVAMPGWRKQTFALALLVAVIFPFRRRIVQEIQVFMRRPSFFLFLLGTIVTCLWAELVSQRELLTHRGDRAIEEVLELAGYFLILMGVVEEYIAQWPTGPRRSNSLCQSRNSS